MNKKYIKEKLNEMEDIINEMMEDEYERADDENFLAILDKIETLRGILLSKENKNLKPFKEWVKETECPWK